MPFRKHLWGMVDLMRFFRYYEGGVSSVYFWDLDDGFAGVVLLKKSTYIECFLQGVSRHMG